jgi:glyoxylase-like metal-dependent hydrolase (beta-lactamase superfamily II)
VALTRGVARHSPLVRSVLAPIASPMTAGGTNTYLAGAVGAGSGTAGDLAVIDPGPEDAAHTNAILNAAGDGRIEIILLTHRHIDHAGGAGALAARTGAPVVQHPAIREGDIWRVGGATLEAIYTPGHASDHVAFLLREERALFAGDLVMVGSSIMIAPPDGDMAVYLESLARVRALGPARIYPGHGPVIDAPAGVLDEAVRHRQAREAQIIEALHSGPARIADLVSRIYVDVPASRHPMAARSVHAQLLKLRAEGRVRGGDAEAEWRLSR